MRSCQCSNLYPAGTKKPSGQPILGFLRQTAEPRRTKIPPQWYRKRHGEPPSFATLNQIGSDLGIPDGSRPQGLGISSYKSHTRLESGRREMADLLSAGAQISSDNMEIGRVQVGEQHIM
jgi:hypothetical protein